MLKVKFEYNEKEKTYRLKMKGHCSYAKPGKDIVCAAASILCLEVAQTVQTSREMLECKPQIINHNGKAYIEFKPKEEHDGFFKVVLLTALNGFRVLQNEYPDYVKVE